MRQLLVEDELAPSRHVRFAGEDYHYLVHVLRMRPGQVILVLDTAGVRWSVELRSDEDTCMTGVVVQVDAQPRASDHAPTGPPGESTAPEGATTGNASVGLPRITIYQAIPKGSTFDEMIRALVQFGASRVCPIVTERTVVRPGRANARGDRWNRTERWQRIAREAVQQSGAANAVRIDDPVDLADLRSATDALSLLLHTNPLAQTTLHGYLGEIPAEVEIVVGPEGGFTDREIDALVASGFQPLWLGPHVLRSESAALFAVAALRLIVLERYDWEPITANAR